MDWYYAIDGRRNGPVSNAQLDELLRAGTIDHKTLIWREGFAIWQPLHVALTQLPPPLPAGIPPLIAGEPQAVCVECKKWFRQSEMVSLQKLWVCAACKPILLQRIQEGSPLPQNIGGRIWRLHRQLVLQSDAALPDRCVLCDVPTNGYRLKRELSWSPPGFQITRIRRKAVLYIALCEEHRKQRKRWLVIAWTAALVGVSLILIATFAGNVVFACPFLLLMIAGGVIDTVKRPVVSPTLIEKEFIRVKGAGEPFLAGFPEWTGPL